MSGKQHGPGKYSDRYGKTVHGVWKSGKRVRAESMNVSLN
jgi:hypothetical protein